MPSASAPSQLARRQEKPSCGAKTKAGTPCKRVAGFGTDHVGYGHCRMHGGNTPNGEVHAARLEAAALALEYQVEPHEALLRAVGQAARWELECRRRVADLDETQLAAERLTVKQGENGTTVERSNVADLNVWVHAHQRAIAQLAQIAKTAIDAGVEERRVRIAEALGGELADVLAAIFERLELTPAQRQAAGPIVRQQLELLEGGRDETEAA